MNDKYLGLITICDRWAASTGVILNVYLIFKEFARNFVSFHLVIEVLIILIALKVFSISRDSSRRGCVGMAMVLLSYTVASYNSSWSCVWHIRR